MEQLKPLKTLSTAELWNLYKNNAGFAEAVDGMTWDELIWQQEEEGRLIGAEQFKFYNHYNSFYLTAPDPEKLAGKLNADYMTAENAGTYRQLCDAVDEWEAMTWDEQDERPEVYERAESLASKLADGITEQLRAFENITDDAVKMTLDTIAEGWRACSEWVTDGVKVIEYLAPRVYA